MSMASFVINTEPTTSKHARQMSLDEFMKEAGGDELNSIFSRINTGSYSACHTAFYEATGIWIPELVPVFQKMDAMAVMGGDIRPREIG